MTEGITFASKLSDFELSAFFDLAGKADLALMDLERIIRDTGAEVTIKDVRKSVALLNGYIIEEMKQRCAHGR